MHKKYGLAAVQNRVFNYNYAVPWTIGKLYDKSRANILNFNNTKDPIPKWITTDPGGWFWARHGRDITFTADGDPNTGLWFIVLGHHRAELYQREVIRGTGFSTPFQK